MMNVKNMPKEVKNAIKNVVTARETWNIVDSADKATRKEILSNEIFTEEENGERIAEQWSDFLMGKEDFEKYCKLVYSRNCEKGFDAGSWELNFFPIQKRVWDEENILIDTLSKDIPNCTKSVIETIKTSPKRRAEFLALIEL